MLMQHGNVMNIVTSRSTAHTRANCIHLHVHQSRTFKCEGMSKWTRSSVLSIRQQCSPQHTYDHLLLLSKSTYHLDAYSGIARDKTGVLSRTLQWGGEYTLPSTEFSSPASIYLPERGPVQQSECGLPTKGGAHDWYKGPQYLSQIKILWHCEDL